MKHCNQKVNEVSDRLLSQPIDNRITIEYIKKSVISVAIKYTP